MEITLRLNAKFQPIHRFELEDALQEVLVKMGRGEVIGGGTIQATTGEVEFCEIEMTLDDAKEDNICWLKDLLNKMGIPKKSFLNGEGISVEVGTLEGLAYYSNGQDLSEEVYRTCDINYVIERMEKAMDGIGRMYSYWEGPKYTGLYFYGTSFLEMKKRIEPFIAEYPLCQKSKIEQIA
ncbi:MAG: hypothetical protein IJC02_03235 [Lachnospiraceae bacterium]|nr:hypothetical protein [Lachnospiraceae bacterium]